MWRAVQHEIQHRALDDQIVEVARQQLLHADARDVRRVRVLLRIGGVEPVLVLDVDHLPCAEHLGDQEAAGVGALRRNAARRSGLASHSLYGGMPWQITAPRSMR